MINRIKKIFIGIIITLISVVILLLGIFYYFEELHVDEVTRTTSEDQEYTLILYSIGSPQWPFGPTDARLVLKKDDKVIEKCDFIVYQDGGITYNAWDVYWYEDYVEIIFTDRRLVEVTMYYDGSESVVSEEE